MTYQCVIHFKQFLNNAFYSYVSFQAVGGKARQLKMTRIIKRSTVVRRLVRWLCVLPLLPQHLIKKGFLVTGRDTIKRGVARKMIALLKYWVRTWLPKVHVLSVSGCSDRTSNGCECDNRMLQDAVYQKRPSVWDFQGK